MTSQQPQPISTINFETLKGEYNTLLLDYDKSRKDILDFIINNKINLVSMGNNTTLIGGSNLSNESAASNVETVADCIALCSTTTSCKGANFLGEGDTKTCKLFSGNSTITFDPVEGNMAIVSDLQSKIYISKGLNIKLQNVNRQINNYLHQALPKTEEQMQLNIKSKNILHTQYDNLLSDRHVLKGQENDLKDISNQHSNKEINVAQITGQYTVWTVFTVIVLSITLILYAVPDINILEKFPILFLIVILLIAYFIYVYIQTLNITNPNVDMAYNINKINYFNY